MRALTATAAFILPALALLASAGAPARAQLYAYDSQSAELGVFDPTTGVFSAVGTLATPGGGVADLEFVGDRLFALELDYPTSGWLLEIDPNTAGTLARVPITRGGSPLACALDSIGYDGGTLYLAYADGGPGCGFSNAISPIGFDGVVDPATQHRPTPDHDGMASRAGGGLWAADRETGLGTCRLYVLSSPPASAALAREYPITSDLDGFHELTDTGEEIFVSDFVTDRLYRIDRETFDILGSTPYPSGREIVSIAARRNPSCNPADLAQPFGLLDLADINAFTASFVAMDPIADLNADGLFDLGDINLFVTSFLAGCP